MLVVEQAACGAARHTLAPACKCRCRDHSFPVYFKFRASLIVLISVHPAKNKPGDSTNDFLFIIAILQKSDCHNLVVTVAIF